MGVVPFVRRKNALTTAGAVITSITDSGVAASKGIKMYPYQNFALWLDISVAGGTTPTLDIDFEHSEDSTNGVNGTWATMQAFRSGAATTVDGSMNQITTATGAYVSAVFPVQASQSGYVRAAFVTGGSSPAYTVDSIKWLNFTPAIS